MASRSLSAESRTAHKGQQTKASIIDAALRLATQIGLEGLSIGALAEVAHMSKSGVFAHFGSREELQLSVVREYHERFENEVFYPALKAERGLPRLKALFENWTRRTSAEIDTGCLYISGAAEFDDRPGPVRDALASSVKTWLAAVYRGVLQARDEGHLAADMDAQQMVFELHGLILALQYEARFLRSAKSLDRTAKGFDNILLRYGAHLPKAPKVAVKTTAKSVALRKPSSSSVKIGRSAKVSQ